MNISIISLLIIIKTFIIISYIDVIEFKIESIMNLDAFLF